MGGPNNHTTMTTIVSDITREPKMSEFYTYRAIVTEVINAHRDERVMTEDH